MTGNGKHTIYKNGDLEDGLLLFYPHYIVLVCTINSSMNGW
jgi:hypothetical protein